MTRGDGMGGDDQGVDWPTCRFYECNGIRLTASGECLAHAEGQDLDAELKRLGDEGTIDARGVTISAELLHRILEAAPHAKRPHRPRFTKASFAGATFGDDASFQGVRFGDEVSFQGARFGDRANFEGARFGDRASFDGATFAYGAFAYGAWFGGATFGDEATFVEATFGDEVGFRNATFGDGASFEDATFGDSVGFQDASFGTFAKFRKATFGNMAGFEGATFGDTAWFGDAIFGDGAEFYNATFGEGAYFGGATFGDSVGFAGATFGDGAEFDGATFGDLAGLGPLLACGQFVLDLATFGRDPKLAIYADRLSCRGMRLTDGAVIEARWAEVCLDAVDFGRPSVLAGVDPFPDLDESPLQARVAQPWRTARPRLLSLRGSDLRNLVLSNVDLRACRFAGAHNLDQLRLEATIDLADRPSGLRVGSALPPLWHWTRRRTLAEEHRWRRTRPKPAGWYPPACRMRDPAKPEPPLRPADIAMLYRALRKGREDSKDEPGAADFYYGEMEMRRHDRTAPWPERMVLWLYWLVAGYGLRASRALGWLLGLLALATVLLATAGFAPAPAATPLTVAIIGTPLQQRSQPTANPPPEMTAERPFPDRLGTAALVAVEGAVFRTSDQALTYKGRLIQAGLRFAGPVLLGLALLSIRGRIKR
jgi:uncharacterized protein YjbI with pentapeptide repeats